MLAKVTPILFSNSFVYVCSNPTSKTVNLYDTAGKLHVLCLQFAPGTLFVPRSNAPAQLDMASMQYVVHSNDADQQMHGQPLSHQYLPNDSMLFQHYADMDMAQPGGLRNLLQAETHGTPTANYGMDRGVAGKTPLHVLKLSVCVYVCVCVCEKLVVFQRACVHPCASLEAGL